MNSLMSLSAPPSMEQDHQALLQLLVKVQQLSGKTGSLAESLAKPLQQHMDKEESLVLPLLGLLRDSATGKMGSASARKASKLYATLQKEYPRMLRGHQELRTILDRLKKVGGEEGHLTAVRFAEVLQRHSQEEEEVFYPAALLVGKVASASHGS